MRTLYIECNMGAAGDMLMAALLELHPDGEGFISKMNRLGIPGVQVRKETAVKCGITGTHIEVSVDGIEEESRDIPPGYASESHKHSQDADHIHASESHKHSQDADHIHASESHKHSQDADHIHASESHKHSQDADHIHMSDIHTHEHEAEDHIHTQTEEAHNHYRVPHNHTNLSQIENILHTLPVSEQVKEDALAVYKLIAEAESQAHGMPVEKVHFHEVGMMDAVADIVGVCLLMEELAPDRVVVSPVNVGSGQVKCAHGILPVPVPATAEILKGVPVYGGEIRGELCTPTGAALLRHFAGEFKDRPVMITEKTGYGMGKKDFPVVNCVRVFLGETDEPEEAVSEMVCNLDDMTGEELGFAMEKLLESGALDVYMVPIQMKKNRPGHMLVCLCKPEDEDEIAAVMLQYTSTFGVRSSRLCRRTLDRSFRTVETQYGSVRVKTGSGYGVTKSKAEYEDLARIARERGLSVARVRKDLNSL